MRTILLVCILLLMAAAAPAQVIPCPLTQARTEIVTPIPSPWWQTPQVGHLTGTSIDTIGGKPTLVCKYWAYGTNASVMRLPPKGTTCTATKTGFVCK
jgi:hypothetical protein